MSLPNEIVLDSKIIGKGRAQITITFPDTSTTTDEVAIGKRQDRERFLDELCEGREGLDRAELATQLEQIAASFVKPSDVSDVSDVVSTETSHATQLVQLAQRARLFRTPGGYDAEAYAVIDRDGHHEVLPLESKAFRHWLSREFYKKFGKAAGAQAATDALSVLTGMVMDEGEEHEVAVRIAEAENTIYLDLADAEGRVVEIDARGFRVIPNTQAPVFFVTRRGMLQLPVPVTGGSVDELRPLVNLPDDKQWILFIAFLIGSLRARGPFAILRVEGEHGSAKSTISKFVRELIDPNKGGVRRLPRTDRDLMIAAKNAHVVAFDNLSRVSRDMSDALCSLATGGALATRELYSDDDEKIFVAMRPIVLNGIDGVGSRPDLLDRCIGLYLPTIPTHKRRPEDQIWSEFERVRPRVLGALLAAVSRALADVGTVELSDYPRMADFSKWVVAAEPALGWERGIFLDAFYENREEADRTAVEASPIGQPLLELVGREPWTGTASRLLDELGDIADERVAKHRDWPSNAKRMSHALRRIAPNLRAIGVEVDMGERDSSRNRERLIRLAVTGKETSETSETSDIGPDGVENVDSVGRSSDVSPVAATQERPNQNGLYGPPVATSDVMDVSDVSSATTGTDDLDEEMYQWEL